MRGILLTIIFGPINQESGGEWVMRKRPDGGFLAQNLIKNLNQKLFQPKIGQKFLFFSQLLKAYCAW